MPVRFAGAAYRAVGAGANLAVDGTVGHRTWEEFLAERVGQPASSRSAAGRSSTPS